MYIYIYMRTICTHAHIYNCMYLFVFFHPYVWQKIYQSRMCRWEGRRDVMGGGDALLHSVATRLSMMCWVRQCTSSIFAGAPPRYKVGLRYQRQAIVINLEFGTKAGMTRDAFIKRLCCHKTSSFIIDEGVTWPNQPAIPPWTTNMQFLIPCAFHYVSFWKALEPRSCYFWKAKARQLWYRNEFD